MQLEKPINENYCAVVVDLHTFVDLPNCDNLKAAIIFGNQVIVSKDTAAGSRGLFFPIETALSPEFLSTNNLYRPNQGNNADPAAKGFFDNHGRVRAVKFRGNKSEGFWIPLAALGYLGIAEADVLPGLEFDAIDGRPICHKYVSRHNPARLGGGQPRTPKIIDRLVANQFKFHIDTAQLRRNPDKILPTDLISISDKWHGTSAIYGNLLTTGKRPPWWKRWLGFLPTPSYDFVWSSRRVIKGIGEEAKQGVNHFYSSDIWGTVGQEIRDLIPKGMTIYGEIVGWTPDGSPIQKGYHYGCQPGQHRFLVYRATLTNPDGFTLELSWKQLKDFCQKFGLEVVKQYYHGFAGDFGDAALRLLALTRTEAWQDAFCKEVERQLVRDGMCPHNNAEVPAEGIVIKVERLDEAVAFKMKNYRFLEAETRALDKGEENIEDAQSAEGDPQ